MKTKVVRRSTVLPADRDRIFELLANLKTLQHIAAPLASFEAVDGAEDIRWKEGEVFSFRFRMFCPIPCGTHTIRVVEFAKRGIYTNESNTHVPIWNHRITLKDNGDKTAGYADEVEIGAGWKTSIVWLWANCFYAHRQKRWRKLLTP